LADEILQLKNENAELYKTNASNAQRIVSLIDEAQALQEKVKHLEKEYFGLI
jgi:precorrin-4 methylase